MANLKAFLKNKYFILISLIVVWFVADQVTKYYVVDKLTAAPYSNGQCLDGFERFWSCPHPARLMPHEVLGQALTFVYVENPGAAFGSFTGLSDKARPVFLLALVLVAVVMMIIFYLRTAENQLLLRISLASVIGGAIGNWVDRFRLSYVIDFISNDFGFWPFHPWPTYNVADIAVTVGVILILLDGVFFNRNDNAAPAANK